ncbi:putative starp antigen [Schistosoma mansoni]|uniref:putative starp antigen n=1 Tax=Schistosoma mansoni TaxID=6183 RepID=UPI00022DC4C4|nr:putative starp antigen [Schistosoma mansoni]|eukprot:XP_018651430.1 putative starp antigen [Schistosoma mansoni]
MLKPSDSPNVSAACEPFRPYGIAPGLVKQRHNTYPNRRIQSAGRASDLPTPASLTVHRLNGRPRTENFLNTLKPSRESPASQVSLRDCGKSTPPVHANEYRTQTAICGHRVENISGYNTVSSNMSSVGRDKSFSGNRDLLNFNENKNKPKESEPSSFTKNNIRTDFKHPAILPKPSKSELSKDSLVDFMIPRGYQGSKRSSQCIYSADERFFTKKSENPSTENAKSRSLEGGYTLFSNQACLADPDQKNATIKTNTRNHTIANPFVRLNDSYPNHTTIKSKNASNSNSTSDLWGKDEDERIKVSSTFTKSNKPLESIACKRSTTSDTTQVVTEPVNSNSVCPRSSRLNGNPYHTAQPVIVNGPKTTKPISTSVKLSSVSPPLQPFSKIQSGRKFSQVKRKLFQSENSNYSEAEDSSLPIIKPEKSHQNLNDKEDTEIFTAVRTVQQRNTVSTEKSNSVLSKSKFNLTPATKPSIKGSELPGNISSKKVDAHPTDIREPIKSAVVDINVSNASTNGLDETSKNTVVDQSHKEDTEKTYPGENNKHHKANEKLSNLPYHKRQVNYTILDSVMGEMEQLFSGKQTNTQSKLSRIHSFAREKAMQCREERENNEHNDANDSNLAKTPEEGGVDKNSTTAFDSDSYSNIETISSVPQPKNERQSEGFQAALRAVEKNLKLFSGTEDSQSLKSNKIDDVSENIIKDGSNSQIVCPATEKRSAHPCNCPAIMVLGREHIVLAVYHCDNMRSILIRIDVV